MIVVFMAVYAALGVPVGVVLGIVPVLLHRVAGAERFDWRFDALVTVIGLAMTVIPILMSIDQARAGRAVRHERFDDGLIIFSILSAWLTFAMCSLLLELLVGAALAARARLSKRALAKVE